MDKKELTEREKRNKRKEYMKKYYLRRKYAIGNGKHTRSVKKIKSINMNTNLLIKKGEFIVSFN